MNREDFYVILSLIGATVLLAFAGFAFHSQNQINRMQERSSRYQTCMQRAQTPRDCENILGHYVIDEDR